MTVSPPSGQGDRQADDGIGMFLLSHALDDQAVSLGEVEDFAFSGGHIVLIATAEGDPMLFRFEDGSHIIQAMINALLGGIDGHSLMGMKVFLRKLGQ